MRPRWRGVALIAGGLVLAPAGAMAAGQMGVDVRIESFYTSDQFPGGEAPEPDWGTRFVVEPRWTARLRGKWRVRPWVRSVVERNYRWPDRDLARWAAGIDLKRGPHRLRVYGGYTPDELYFPSDIGDARLDRTGAGGELRLGTASGWLAGVGGEVEKLDFVPIYDERDETRWTIRTSLERALGTDRAVRLVHVYRRSDSVSHLYTYQQNALRAETGWRLGSWDTSLQGEVGLRNYRTGLLYASNFGRQDDRWRVRAGIARLITPTFAAEAFGEWRRNDSTRESKEYTVHATGLAVTYSR